MCETSSRRNFLPPGKFRRQSFSGLMAQFNVWSFALEDYDIENNAECRADNWGDIFAWKMDMYEFGEEYIDVSQRVH